MTQVRRQNFFNTTWGVIKFTAFWLVILLLMPRAKMSVAYMRVFMGILVFFAGIKIRVHGKLSDMRPLMVVCNHISVFELATFPVAFGGSFFGKNSGLSLSTGVRRMRWMR